MHYFFIINLVSTLHNCLTKMVEGNTKIFRLFLKCSFLKMQTLKQCVSFVCRYILNIYYVLFFWRFLMIIVFNIPVHLLHLGSPPVFGGSVLLIFLAVCVVFLCYFLTSYYVLCAECCQYLSGLPLWCSLTLINLKYRINT